MRFVKMHGLGNDYVFVDGRLTHVDDPAEVSRQVSDRHRGVGSDGLILIDPPDDPTNHARMRMFNADGSRGEMCGNGIRCIAKFLVDRGITEDEAVRIETDGGLRRLGWSRGVDGRVASVDVDMGPPTLAVDRIPADLPGMEPGATAIEWAFDPKAFELDPTMMERAGIASRLTLVSMGNPHVVIRCDDVGLVPLDGIGPVIERHSWFPNRINVHFVEAVDPGSVRVVTWERGSGPTRACGSGACAVCVAGVLGGWADSPLRAMLPGGVLELHWSGAEADPVMMRGPATEVFEGDIELAGTRRQEAHP
ncbi:MAG: diaminopimelate epimerase [Planctomycetia bacterium]|nr:diaminopimelate epimerase [Planctomycetia bacterium]